jgi:hypothetical protein
MKKIILVVIVAILAVIPLIHAIYPFFVPDKIPANIPNDMQKIVDALGNESTSDMDFLQKAYDAVNSHYTSPSMGYLKEPQRLIEKNLDNIWANTGYFPCDKQNYVLKVMLVKSRWFNETDVKETFTSCIITPHYYLKIKMNNGTYIDADMWGADHGYKLGEHAGGYCSDR